MSSQEKEIKHDRPERFNDSDQIDPNRSRTPRTRFKMTEIMLHPNRMWSSCMPFTIGLSPPNDTPANWSMLKNEPRKISEPQMIPMIASTVTDVGRSLGGPNWPCAYCSGAADVSAFGSGS